jgi:hypothetical protein
LMVLWVEQVNTALESTTLILFVLEEQTWLPLPSKLLREPTLTTQEPSPRRYPSKVLLGRFPKSAACSG